MSKIGLPFFLFIFLPFVTMSQNKAQALSDLKKLLFSEKEWVKIHVAEFLIWEGHQIDVVKNEFLKEELLYSNTPKYRIGIWRVLAQCESDPENKSNWVQKIISAYQNRNGEDRLHAIETLAKLKVPVVKEMDISLKGSMRLYSLWNYALGAEEKRKAVKSRIIADLLHKNLTELEILVSSYILRYIGPLSTEQYNSLSDWFSGGKFSPAIKSNLLVTLLLLLPEEEAVDRSDHLKKSLLALINEDGCLNNILLGFAEKAAHKDLAQVRQLYDLCSNKNSLAYDSNLHVSAAYMLLKVLSRLGEQ
ncbi:conserved hypothetical protein [Sphingobacterium multivorum]|uniref:Uncharacterized protein n=2 Tax=Sphingobacteriaceae TaxID=84566 RepID=A0A654BBY3_SPHMU|nr:conserved hypothetical protein [Sphingobacterium multivorum]